MPRPVIRPARPEDCNKLHQLILGLAEYERLAHLAVGSVEMLRAELFAERPVIEAALAWDDGEAVGFALWFSTYSTFLARQGLWLEDLFVIPEARGKGYGTMAPAEGRQHLTEHEPNAFTTNPTHSPGTSKA